MRTKTITLYKFNELSDAAKEKARDWYRQFVFADNNDWDHVIDDANDIAKIFGLDISKRRATTMGGSIVEHPAIYFQLSYSQSDGASYDGTYSYKSGSVKEIKEHAPQDKELHRIVLGLQNVQRKHFYKLTAYCVTRRSDELGITVEHGDDQYRDIGDSAYELRDLLRAFAQWIYKRLRDECDFQSADEQVDDSIEANEYEFNEDGSAA
jgi:hypothetical protein